MHRHSQVSTVETTMDALATAMIGNSPEDFHLFIFVYELSSCEVCCFVCEVCWWERKCGSTVSSKNEDSNCFLKTYLKTWQHFYLCAFYSTANEAMCAPEQAYLLWNVLSDHFTIFSPFSRSVMLLWELHTMKIIIEIFFPVSEYSY